MIEYQFQDSSGVMHHGTAKIPDSAAPTNGGPLPILYLRNDPRGAISVYDVNNRSSAFSSFVPLVVMAIFGGGLLFVVIRKLKGSRPQ